MVLPYMALPYHGGAQMKAGSCRVCVLVLGKFPCRTPWLGLAAVLAVGEWSVTLGGRHPRSRVPWCRQQSPKQRIGRGIWKPPAGRATRRNFTRASESVCVNEGERKCVCVHVSDAPVHVLVPSSACALLCCSFYFQLSRSHGGKEFSACDDNSEAEGSNGSVGPGVWGLGTTWGTDLGPLGLCIWGRQRDIAHNAVHRLSQSRPRGMSSSISHGLSHGPFLPPPHRAPTAWLPQAPQAPSALFRTPSGCSRLEPWHPGLRPRCLERCPPHDLPHLLESRHRVLMGSVAVGARWPPGHFPRGHLYLVLA